MVTTSTVIRVFVFWSTGRPRLTTYSRTSGVRLHTHLRDSRTPIGFERRPIVIFRHGKDPFLFEIRKTRR